MGEFIMEVLVAKTSGFCFGVDRSIKIANELLNSGRKICTLGKIIHNPLVVNELSNKGAKIINHPCNLPNNSTLVIRSHGVSSEIFDYIKSNNIDYVDATCPFVKKIHQIVKNHSEKCDILLAAGDENHPEMIGIRSYFNGKSYVFKNLDELKKIIENHPQIKEKKSLVVSQTTFSVENWKKCVNYIKLCLNNILIFDTICKTTVLRQKEAEKLSKKCDLVIVIGGKESSNTKKLYEICSKTTETVLVESKSDIPEKICNNKKCIGIIAGASTPISLVNEIKKHLEMISNGIYKTYRETNK